jgi:hypothetical protein
MKLYLKISAGRKTNKQRIQKANTTDSKHTSVCQRQI